MNRPELIRGIVFLILVGLFAHFGMVAWAKPKPRPRPAYVFPCVPSANNLQLGYKSGHVWMQWGYGCSVGTSGGCSIALVERLFVWDTLTNSWVEIEDDCLNLGAGCGSNSVPFEQSLASFGPNGYGPGDYNMIVHIFAGTCNNPGASLAVNMLDFQVQ